MTAFCERALDCASLRIPSVRASGKRVQTGNAERQGAWRDDVFVERPWRSVKYEEVYLRGYDSVSQAYFGIKETAMAA